MTARCKVCDRPEATDEQWDTVNEGERPDLCWGEHLGCSTHRVDWRERALRAERLSADAAELAAVRGVALLEAQAEAERLRATLGGRISAMAAELERTQDALATLRRDFVLLVRAHLHPSDDYRMRVFREAMARVEGWGQSTEPAFYGQRPDGTPVRLERDGTEWGKP